MFLCSSPKLHEVMNKKYVVLFASICVLVFSFQIYAKVGQGGKTLLDYFTDITNLIVLSFNDPAQNTLILDNESGAC